LAAFLSSLISHHSFIDFDFPIAHLSERKKTAALFIWKERGGLKTQTSRRLGLDASLRDERRSGVLLHKP
jgi:hypothetical protein